MYKLRGQLRQLRDWWFYLCTGRSEHGPLDEEHYRQRILVMTSCFWLLTVIATTILMPLVIDLTPEGELAADALFVATSIGVLSAMLVLRYLQDRITSLNILLCIFTGAFSAACFVFGGSASPTLPLLLLVPVMASIVGNISIAVAWGTLVFGFWAAVLIAERSGYEFMQIIKPENHSIAMLNSYMAMGVAVVSVILIYAEMNKSLRLDLQESNRELAHLSSHDQLTRLPNRRFYDQRMDLALRRAADRQSMTALLFQDLNDFKKINDTHGHGAGDKLLLTVAQRIQSTLRETDLVARLGGDEFAAVLEDVRSTEEVTRIAHKLSQAIEQPVSVRQLQLQFSASIGVAIFPLDGRQKAELEEKADKAMYQAKKRGIPVALSSLEADNALHPVRQRRDV
ncbi:MAG: GGDEF domain-containing protein [Halioglobus sp.]